MIIQMLPQNSHDNGWCTNILFVDVHLNGFTHGMINQNMAMERYAPYYFRRNPRILKGFSSGKKIVC